MDTQNPTAYEELGPTRLSTCSEPASPRNVPSAVKRLIGELGLRYRPSAQADLEAHAGTIALLARDLADVPPVYLERAIRKWVLTSHFMPKASDLVELAQEFLNADKPIPKRGGPYPWEQEDTFDPATRCTPQQAVEIMAEFGLRRMPFDTGGF
jgi:hypothetical protein